MERIKKLTDKYNLRRCSLNKRIEVEARKGLPKKRGPKAKPKSQPLTRYRRKTANLRERIRMGEINTAFENLRQKIPQSESSTSNRGKSEKLTKINVLHVAINYIKAMENIINTGEPGVQVFGTSVIRSPEEGPRGIDNLRVEVNKSKNIKISKSQGKVEPLSPNKPPILNDNSEMVDDFDNENTLGDWPDWTELTSTLDFPTSPAVNMKLLLKPDLGVIFSNIKALQGNKKVRFE